VEIVVVVAVGDRGIVVVNFREEKMLHVNTEALSCGILASLKVSL
jgi:hypothetical protein